AGAQQGLPGADADAQREPAAHLYDEQRGIVHQVLGRGVEQEARSARDVAQARHGPPSVVAGRRGGPLWQAAEGGWAQQADEGGSMQQADNNGSPELYAGGFREHSPT